MNTGDILHHITVAGKAEDPVQTRDALLTYHEWLVRERQRIRTKSGWPVEIYKSPTTGEISLVLLRTNKR
ncbi:MAG: hypothetical protein EBS89_14255 [Proteobacteria bacterium]|jgi:hypothetical protein|nr:hypothetical protein [Pseudomonadota bacterium]